MTDTGVRRVSSADLTPDEDAALRALMLAAFGTDPEEGFSDDDWKHSLGGVHFIVDLDGAPIAHAAVVERDIRVDGRPLRTAYVEAVATAPGHQGSGLGSRVMADVGAYIRDGFELGVLGTGRQSFYDRLGWEIWMGPSFVRTADRDTPTPDEDGYLLVLRTPSTPDLDPTAPISCEWRPGDVW